MIAGKFWSAGNNKKELLLREKLRNVELFLSLFPFFLCVHFRGILPRGTDVIGIVVKSSSGQENSDLLPYETLARWSTKAPTRSRYDVRQNAALRRGRATISGF